MPIPYRYYSCPSFPKLELNEMISSVQQMTLFWGPACVESKIAYLGLAQDTSFERYSVEHQFEREIDIIYQSEEVHQVIQVIRFLAFYNRAKGYFLLMTGKREAKTLFQRFRAYNPPIYGEPGNVDLAKVQEFGPTTGAWFARLRIDEVSSVGLFGTEQIVDSDEWARYSTVGVISALNMRITDREGTGRSVQITKDRVILIMKDSGEGQNLALTAKINDLIDGAQASQSAAPATSTGT